MITLDVEQGTQEWIKARAGLPTASNFDKIITTQGAPSKQAEKYLYQLAGERVSGFVEESYKNGFMQRGIEIEDEARQFYELINSVSVGRVGICYANEAKRYSCSPDGLICESGGLEIKCPIMSTHVAYLLGNKFPMDYFQQVQGNLFVTGRKWWDFLSYYPGLKPLLIRVERDEAFINKLNWALESFCVDLEKVVMEIS